MNSASVLKSNAVFILAREYRITIGLSTIDSNYFQLVLASGKEHLLPMRCQHGNDAPAEMYDKLHHSQAGTGRHKCCACAYESGYQRGLHHSDFPDGHTERCQEGVSAPTNALADLPHSQAGVDRHQCAVCAYDFGFRRGRAVAQ